MVVYDYGVHEVAAIDMVQGRNKHRVEAAGGVAAVHAGRAEQN